MNGVRAYKLARAGEIVVMAAREIEIREMTLVEFQSPLATIDVKCSKGTYIRSLARDLGTALQVPAHLADLRRTECSGFLVEDAISEEDLVDKEKVQLFLRRDLESLKGMKLLQISEFDAARLKNGQRVRLSEDSRNEIVLAARENEPIAICRIENSELISVRGF